MASYYSFLYLPHVDGVGLLGGLQLVDVKLDLVANLGRVAHVTVSYKKKVVQVI